MLFSIIVPVYKVKDYLNECVQSVLDQTFADFELILVDDGSPDECGKMCDDWQQKDQRVKVVHKQNGGLVSARKAGAEIASGEYILNVDSDDYIGLDLLESMEKIISQCKPDVICFGYTPFGGNTDKAIMNACDTGLYEGEKLDYLQKTYLYDSNSAGINSGTLLFSVVAKCVKRSIYKDCQSRVPNDVVSGEDTVFTRLLTQTVKKVYVSDYVGYFYRQVNTSIEHQFNGGKFEKLDRVYNALRVFSQGEEQKNTANVYFFYRAWFYCCGLAIVSKNYKSFKKEIKENYDHKTNKKILANLKIGKNNIQSSIKIKLLKGGHWRLLYLLAKTYFKDKLGL